MKDNKGSVYPLVLAENFDTLPFLSLGIITANLRRYSGNILNDFYEIKPLTLAGVEGHSVEQLYEVIKSESAPVCLLSSYVWNHAINMTVAREIKSINPRALVIIGGPEIPKYQGETEKFLASHPFIDIAVLGEGEASCAEILVGLAQSDSQGFNSLTNVTGIVYRSETELVRTPERERLKNIEQLASPYLTGEFEPWFRNFNSAILETNRGCPYGCTYCDWGSATLEKVSKFSPARVAREIEYIADCQTESIFIADANFGMLEQDIEIAETLVSVRKRTGYPRRLYTNFAKNGGRRLMAVIKILHEGGLLPTGIIALQTTDQAVLKTIKRDNIKTVSYEKMMEFFNSENIPMASDIMIGLPGQTIASLEQDLQFCFDWKVSAHGNYTSMMPNAPMAEPSYKAANMIVTDANNMVVSTSTFSEDDFQYMKALYSTYLFHVKMAVSKYYLYFLQIDYQIQALSFLRKWLDAVQAGDPAMPISVRVYRQIFAMEKRTGDWAYITWGDKANFLFDDMSAFYQELHGLAEREFDVSISNSEREAILKAQAAVMPRRNQSYPQECRLDHDVGEYFFQLKSTASLYDIGETFQPLRKFTANTLTTGTDSPHFTSIAFTKMMGHADEGWELSSSLRFY